jgi:hypothetical protein
VCRGLGSDAEGVERSLMHEIEEGLGMDDEEDVQVRQLALCSK